jgi:hypothetical protein
MRGFPIFADMRFAFFCICGFWDEDVGDCKSIEGNRGAINDRYWCLCVKGKGKPLHSTVTIAVFHAATCHGAYR